MLLWNEFKGDDATPKDRRLLLITQPTGSYDSLGKDTYDLVVGHWDKFRGGFAVAEESNITVKTNVKVFYWAELREDELPLTPPMKLRNIPVLL